MFGTNILQEQKDLFAHKYSKEEKDKRKVENLNRKIQEYIANGSVGDLDLSHTPIKSLPDGLKVGGSLYLSDCKNLTSLPDGLKVGRDLDLSYTSITSLPDGLKVEDTLYLIGCKNITSLPHGLEVGYSLFVSETPLGKRYDYDQLLQMAPGIQGRIVGARYSSIKEQKDLFAHKYSEEERAKKKVENLNRRIQEYINKGGTGDLDLTGTPITSLPDGLKVGGSLYLEHTPITSLPDGLKVKGDLSMYKCNNLTSLPDGLEVGRDLYLFSCKNLISLPDGLKVGRHLDLHNTPIISLPNALKVGGDLTISLTPVKSLPDGLEVEGDLWIHETPLEKKYDYDQLLQMAPGVKGGIGGIRRTSIKEQKDLFAHKYSREEKSKRYIEAISRKIQEYIANGSVGDLDLNGTKITSLPDGLKVGGNLELIDTPITSLPNGLKVGGNLHLSYTQITSLPDGLKVGGSLDLSATPITSLPYGLKVGGTLKLHDTQITSLPDGLKVLGALSLNDTQITSLPDGLEVKGNLHLTNTLIKSLPYGLKVGGTLWISNTPLGTKYTNAEIRQMAPGVQGRIFGAKDSSIKEQKDLFAHKYSKEEKDRRKVENNNKKIQQYINKGGKGDLDLTGTSIASLPDGLKVGGRLDLSRTPIKSLPNGLEVEFSLILIDTPIKSLPSGLKVGSSLFVYNTPLGRKYTKVQIRQMAPGVQGSIEGAKHSSIEEQKDLFAHKYSEEERAKRKVENLNRRIQEYINKGSIGDLDLEDALITSLPDGLTVGGTLNLRNTPITSLPDGLTVGGSLDLRNTPITSLPDGLKVGGSLDLAATPITSLPNGLEVGGNLVLIDTPITSLPNGLKVGGGLHLGDCESLTSLPDGLKVRGYLYLGRCKNLTSLPDGLEVKGDLYLSGCTNLTSLPDGLKVGDGLYIFGTPLARKYTEDQIRQMAPGVQGTIFTPKDSSIEEQKNKLFIQNNTKTNMKAKHLRSIIKEELKRVFKEYSTKPAPSKPDTRPSVDPGTAPSEEPRRRITPKPGVRPAPKALKEKVSTKDLANRFLNLKKKSSR